MQPQFNQINTTKAPHNEDTNIAENIQSYSIWFSFQLLKKQALWSWIWNQNIWLTEILFTFEDVLSSAPT